MIFNSHENKNKQKKTFKADTQGSQFLLNFYRNKAHIHTWLCVYAYMFSHTALMETYFYYR